MGDTIDGLGGVAITLVENMPELMRGLKGFDGGIMNLGALEDQLIHFSHARKVSRAERSSVPDSHLSGWRIPGVVEPPQDALRGHHT
jgi:hypothetical protein